MSNLISMYVTLKQLGCIFPSRGHSKLANDRYLTAWLQTAGKINEKGDILNPSFQALGFNAKLPDSSASCSPTLVDARALGLHRAEKALNIQLTQHLESCLKSSLKEGKYLLFAAV